MRRLAFYIALVALASAYGMAKDESVDELKTRFASARPEDRPELAIRIAQHQLRNADKLYIEGKVDQAREAVEDIVGYRKREKNVEIDVRKMADKLRDIKRTLAFEDQPSVEQAIRQLEDIRTTLLKEMFAKKEKK
jgi:hypothetical protein